MSLNSRISSLLSFLHLPLYRSCCRRYRSRTVCTVLYCCPNRTLLLHNNHDYILSLSIRTQPWLPTDKLIRIELLEKNEPRKLAVSASKTEKKSSVLPTCLPLSMIHSFTLPICRDEKHWSASPEEWRSRLTEMNPPHTPLCLPPRMLPKSARNWASPPSTSRSAELVDPRHAALDREHNPPFVLWHETEWRLDASKMLRQFPPTPPDASPDDVVDVYRDEKKTGLALQNNCNATKSKSTLFFYISPFL